MFAGLVAAAVPANGEVLFATGDFTSVIFPMLVQEARGVRVREVPLEQIPEAIDGRTSLVAVSAVQSADGRLVDLDALARAAEHHGADVYLDVTQAAGWLAIDASRFTFVCAGAYKWLLSPRGTAMMAIRPDAVEQVTAHTAGWYAGEDPWTSIYGGPLRLPATAKRFDVSPAWTCWAGTAPSLELIDQLGPAAIGAYDLALAARLRSGLGHAPFRQRDRDRRPPRRRGAPAAGRHQGVGARRSRSPQLPPAGDRRRHRPRAGRPGLTRRGWPASGCRPARPPRASGQRLDRCSIPLSGESLRTFRPIRHQIPDAAAALTPPLTVSAPLSPAPLSSAPLSPAPRRGSHAGRTSPERARSGRR